MPPKSREDQKQHGQLSGGVALDRHVPLQWTEAQKKDIANYQLGQVLVFHRASRGIEKHEALTVASASGEVITTRNGRGDETQVSIEQARSFAVHERQSIEVAGGTSSSCLQIARMRASARRMVS